MTTRQAARVAWVRQALWPATRALLPPEMGSDDALALLVAIGWQESRWSARRQMEGPARGFLQFERAGLDAVLRHQATRRPATSLAYALGYPADVAALWDAIADNDVLGLGLGRLLLWSLPERLPGPSEPDRGWAQYRAAWQPGRPRPETWPEAWAIGWDQREDRHALRGRRRHVGAARRRHGD